MSSREEFEKTMAPLFEENLGMNPDPSVWHKNKNGSYLNPVLEQHFVTWQAATALQAERVRELAKKAIPEPIKMEPFQTIDKASKNYSAGWNACRAEITAKMAIELQAEQALSATARNDAHDWKLQGSAGVWESYYKCSKCGATVQENTDGPSKPETGCAAAREG